MNYKNEIEQLMERVQRLEHLVNELWSAETGELPEVDHPSRKVTRQPKNSAGKRRKETHPLKKSATTRSAATRAGGK